MTREHKLALLIGFALVLVVGVVVSDHFSGARMAQIEETVASARPVDAAFADDPFLVQPLPMAPAPSQVHAMNDPIGSGAVRELGLDARHEPAGAPGAAIASTLSNGLDALEKFTLEMGGRLSPAAVADLPIVETSEGPAIRIPMPQPRNTAGQAEQPAATRSAAAVYPAPKAHNVQKNETLWSIAAKHYGDGGLHTKLAEFNKGRLTARGDLRAGATLLIPSKDELLGRAPAPAARAESAGLPSSRMAPKPETAPMKPAGPAREYTVKKGDTLGDIARAQLGSARRWTEIVDLNGLDDPDHVPAGTVLKLPSK